MNCWEFKKCGREPKGANAKTCGVCPAAMEHNFNGYNNGVNAGRACWMISGTFCDGQVPQGNFVDKASYCHKCPFYRLVASEDKSSHFVKHKKVVPAETRRAYEGVNFTSVGDDEQVILYLLQQLNENPATRQVRLVSLYKELPISNDAEIVDVKGSSVTFVTNELQIAAIKACEETLIGTSHYPIFFLARLKDIDIRHNTVTLNNFSYAELYSEFRKTVRVRLPKPMNVVMHAGHNTVSGVIQDISYGGCGMNTLTIAGLDGAEAVTLKLKLFDPALSQMLEADIPCEVLRIVNNHSPYKVALAFKHNAQTEKVVSKFIHQRELEIVKELRETL